VLKEELGVDHVSVIDVPYLSAVPAGLQKAIVNYEGVVFADDCKRGNAPLASFITSLQGDGLLPHKWKLVAAEPTYNPLGALSLSVRNGGVVDGLSLPTLGTMITFTSTDDIIDSCLVMLNKRRKPKKVVVDS